MISEQLKNDLDNFKNDKIEYLDTRKIKRQIQQAANIIYSPDLDGTCLILRYKITQEHIVSINNYGKTLDDEDIEYLQKFFSSFKHPILRYFPKAKRILNMLKLLTPFRYEAGSPNSYMYYLDFSTGYYRFKGLNNDVLKICVLGFGFRLTKDKTGSVS